MKRQQTLQESAGRNVQERIKEIQTYGDGYLTVAIPCSNLQANGSCKAGLPNSVVGCHKGTICGFFVMGHAE